MGSRERVSDWEADEIEGELRSGATPENVAFQHGLGVSDVKRIMRLRGLSSDSEPHQWTQAETLLVRDNYPQHGPDWVGWKEFLPGMSWVNIKAKAHRMGVKAKVRPKQSNDFLWDGKSWI